MRLLSSCSLMRRVILGALAQPMAERHAFVEHKALAAPAGFGFRHFFEISEDAALEVIDLGKAVREQQRACLLAADAAGAEHRDPPVLRRIEFLRGKFPELAEAGDLWIKCAFER